MHSDHWNQIGKMLNKSNRVASFEKNKRKEKGRAKL